MQPYNHDTQSKPTRKVAGIPNKAESSRQEPRSKVSVDSPTSLDVLCGRGKSHDQSPGNIEFRRVVREFATEYFATTRMDKHIVLQKIAQTFTDKGMRFIKRQPDDTWEELDVNAIKQKIGHALRDATPEGKVAKAFRQQMHTRVTEPVAAGLTSQSSVQSPLPDPMIEGYYSGATLQEPQGDLVSALLDDIRKSKRRLLLTEEVASRNRNDDHESESIGMRETSLPVTTKPTKSEDEKSVLGQAERGNEDSPPGDTSSDPSMSRVASQLSPAMPNSDDSGGSPISPNQITGLFDQFKANRSDEGNDEKE